MSVLCVDSGVSTDSEGDISPGLTSPIIDRVVNCDNCPDYYTPMVVFIILFVVSLLIIALLVLKLYRK